MMELLIVARLLDRRASQHGVDLVQRYIDGCVRTDIRQGFKCCVTTAILEKLLMAEHAHTTMPLVTTPGGKRELQLHGTGFDSQGNL
jgi:hypothetical protein